MKIEIVAIFSILILLYSYFKFNRINLYENMNNDKRMKIVLCYANWCSHCKTFLPIFNDLKSQYEHKYNIIAVEENDNSENQYYLNYISHYPTLIIDYDKKIHIYDGSMDKDSVLNYINGFR